MSDYVTLSRLLCDTQFTHASEVMDPGRRGSLKRLDPLLLIKGNDFTLARATQYRKQRNSPSNPHLSGKIRP